MNQQLQHRLETFFHTYPFLRASEGASLAEIAAAELALAQSFPEDYRLFLHHYGGAIVGPYPLYGLRVVEAMRNWTMFEANQHYRQTWLGDTITDWLIISSDHTGNPIGVPADGQIWTDDHDFGMTVMLADSFEMFLLQLLARSSYE